MVAIIGDNKAIDDVNYLVNIAKKVYFINSENDASNKENVENFTNVKDYKIIGKDKVENIEVNNDLIKIDGVFYVSDSNNFSGVIANLELENGYIKVNDNMETSIKGIYACGDIINRNIKQVVSACGNGATAALEAIKYVNKVKQF
jgi:thioredoxin reductase (NADPH)